MNLKKVTTNDPAWFSKLCLTGCSAWRRFQNTTARPPASFSVTLIYHQTPANDIVLKQLGIKIEPIEPIESIAIAEIPYNSFEDCAKLDFVKQIEFKKLYILMNMEADDFEGVEPTKF